MQILSSPYLGNARTLVGKLAVVWKQCPDIQVLGWDFHLWYTNWKVWCMYTHIQISPRYCQGHMEMLLWNVALSGRIKLLLSFSSPLIHVPPLSPVSGARILIDLHLIILGFWNKAYGACLFNCTENMVCFLHCAIKSNKGFIILVTYCSRMQFCSIKFMSDDILILIHEQLGLWLSLSA